VVAELESWEQKKEIMIKKKNLMRGIYTDNDLTRTEREMQEKLKEKAKEEKEKGNKMRISYGKIMVKWCLRWNERENRLEKEEGRKKK